MIDTTPYGRELADILKELVLPDCSARTRFSAAEMLYQAQSGCSQKDARNHIRRLSAEMVECPVAGPCSAWEPDINK